MTKKEKTHTAVPVETVKEPRELAPRNVAGMFDELRNELEDFWGRPWRSLRSWPHLASLARSERWLPSTDVMRENGTLVVKADMPGMTKDDVKVSLDNGDLVIEGERKQETKTEEKDFLRSECTYGSFYRRLPLPDGVDASKIAAKVGEGVLEVRVPMPAAAVPAPHRIEVR
jgi:HSP20 family protein